jgi:diguanylate cyclase
VVTGSTVRPSRAPRPSAPTRPRHERRAAEPRTKRTAPRLPTPARGQEPRTERRTSFIERIPWWVELVLSAVTVLLLASLLGLLRSRRDLRRAQAAAHHDVVTGLPNRAAAEEALKRLTGQAVRKRSPLAVVMLDLDHFKAINDEHGHAIGDEVLEAVGRVARETVRDGDFVGRWGGEELIVLLPETQTRGAVEVAEKLRCALRERTIAPIGKPVTASCGVSAGLGDRGALAQLVARADEALYRAKDNGRDRTEVALDAELVVC